MDERLLQANRGEGYIFLVGKKLVAKVNQFSFLFVI
jgi:hypothetical protein